MIEGLFVTSFALSLLSLVGLFKMIIKTKNLSHENDQLTNDLQQKSLNIIKLETELLQTQKSYEKFESIQNSLNEERLINGNLKTKLEEERKSWKEKISLLENAENRLQNSFKAASQDALQTNNKSFLELAKSTLEKYQQKAENTLNVRHTAIEELVSPINKTLESVDQKIQILEKARLGAYEVIKHQVSELVISQKDLRSETSNLVKALRTPNVRGRWGEMQLKRVVELTGMSSHCDFIEQANIVGDEGLLRPDMIVRLPGKKQIIIDAKAPMSAYLDALEDDDESSRAKKMKDHARQVRAHINSLSNRAYWDQFKEDSPEFVVLFLPGETFFSAALEADPDLIELGVEKKVILTTPSTLIAMLHAIAYGWRQESLAENAQEISDLGKEVYKRLSDMGSHMSKLGRDLNTAVKSYNSTVGTLERRVLPSARKFEGLKATSLRDNLESIESLETMPRELTAKELAS